MSGYTIPSGNEPSSVALHQKACNSIGIDVYQLMQLTPAATSFPKYLLK